MRFPCWRRHTSSWERCVSAMMMGESSLNRGRLFPPQAPRGSNRVLRLPTVAWVMSGLPALSPMFLDTLKVMGADE